MTTTRQTASTTQRPHILVANNFHPATVEKLDALYQTHKLWLLADPAEQLALIKQLGPFCETVATASWATNPLIYQLPNLKLISGFGVGTDGINFEITRARNIAVTNTPDVLNDAVADLAMGLVLATSRNLVNADLYVRQGKWPDAPFPFTRSLAGKTLGIIGLGAIGEEIAARALPFKMKVAYHNRQPKNLPYTYFDSIEALAHASDILLSMLPGGAVTDKLIGSDVFRALGADGIFINVGRGSAVDEDALANALQHGLIAGAALDVYTHEPHVPDALINQPNIVLAPHIGSATIETRMAMGQLVLDNLAAHFNQQPLLTLAP